MSRRCDTAKERPTVGLLPLWLYGAARQMRPDLTPRGIICVVINPGWVRTDMGGMNATLDPSESISRMRRVIATLGPELSGKFFFNHTGREYPW